MRKAVYNNREIKKRILNAVRGAGNSSQACTRIKEDEGFRRQYRLTQEEVNALFPNQTPPDISKISLITVLKIVKEENTEYAGHKGADMFNGDVDPINVIPKEAFQRRRPKNKDVNPVLRTHQQDGLTAIKKVITRGRGKGKIILPTGTGKTRIEAESVMMAIRSYDKNEWAGVYVVLSPRILLTYQLLGDFVGIIGKEGIDCKYLNVNSGDLSTIEIEKTLLESGFNNPEKVESTTSKDTIKSKIIDAKNNNKPLVIFSTYHSANHVNDAAAELGVEIVSYIYDECQYCVTSGIFQESPQYPSRFKFFFTATEKFTDSQDGLGMQNTERFGERLFIERPSVLIDRGEMASVALHLVGARGEDVDENDYESMAKVVINAFEKHRGVLLNHTFDKDSIGAKMIVVCDKQDSLRGIMRSNALKDYRRERAEIDSEINICAMSSDYGIYINGKHDPRVNNRDKEIVFKKLRGLKPTDEAIVFHVDMISEGIDVAGITAVMPFRSLGKIKFLQNLGRGTRLVKEDRVRLYSGEIRPKEWIKYVKPFCWLILPWLSGTSRDFVERYRDYVVALRSDYDFDPSELTLIDNITGPPEKETTEDIFKDKERGGGNGRGLIKDIIHAIEDKEQAMEFMDSVFGFNKSSDAEQMRILREIYAN